MIFTTNGTVSKLNLRNLHRLLVKHMLEAADNQNICLLPTFDN
jgi:hypothetical protein